MDFIETDSHRITVVNWQKSKGERILVSAMIKHEMWPPAPILNQSWVNPKDIFLIKENYRKFRAWNKGGRLLILIIYYIQWEQ